MKAKLILLSALLELLFQSALVFAVIIFFTSMLAFLEASRKQIVLVGGEPTRQRSFGRIFCSGWVCLKPSAL